MTNIDWPGLLKWSLEYTDGTTASAPRSKEDLEFLQAAMEEYFGSQVDIPKAVEECLGLIRKADAPVAEKLSAIASLVECLDAEPELARNLNKYEGLLETLQGLLNHDDSSVREKAAEFLALALPNNSHIQSLCFSNGMLDVLMQHMTERRAYAISADESENRYFTKIMSVLSALVKHEHNAERKFLCHYNGKQFCEALLKESAYERLRVKLESMLQHISYLEQEKLTEGRLALA